MKKEKEFDYDYIIVGSGFGGSVAALRLSEKGYKVLVLEKGKWFTSNDFAKTNWNLKRWLWIPFIRFYGTFKITFFRHIGILSGVGVGGGSLIYANTLPIPKKEFFNSVSWSHLADWEKELSPFYESAKKMMGVAVNPRMENGDKALKILAKEIGKEDQFELTDVAVFFGEEGKNVSDPYFNGEGPERTGCTFCGGCMVGCRHNAKNTLDKNYLYFAQKNGAEIKSESEVYNIVPMADKDGSDGYEVHWKSSTKILKSKGKFKGKGIVFAGGVLGTIPLLLKLKETTLPNLSDKVGFNVRSNSESLMGIVAPQKETVFSDGVAISSILHTDEHSHLEPVRYPSGSGFWRLQVAPLVMGNNVFIRLLKVIWEILKHPVRYFRFYFVWDWAKKTQILLYMRTISGTLRFTPGRFRMKTEVGDGALPTAFLPEATKLAKKFAEIVKGTPGALLSEIILGIPTTAHILGGATMGKDLNEGVIDKDNRVFGYKNLYVCDGSAISANPGVNPSLTILAISERAMSKVKENR
ncbi:MAG: GMC family oxidoreductase [Ignavibacteriae bacterium HGW-Ignavibacteriae-3]|nr:MAG: GMC family oxidoreductase [Ignavibacteriae bacterium HGW-Ignavibacteriae-3]